MKPHLRLKSIGEQLDPNTIRSLSGFGIVALITCCPTVVVGTLLEVLGRDVFTRIPPFWPFEDKNTARIFSYLDIILFTPCIESVLAFFPVIVLRFFTKKPIPIALICALIWGWLHWNYSASLQHALFSIWPFFCMSLIISKTRRNEQSFTWLRVSAIHGILNATVIGLSHLFN